MDTKQLQNELVKEIGKFRSTFVDSNGFEHEEFKPIITLCDNTALDIREATTKNQIKKVVETSLINPIEQIVGDILGEELDKLHQILQGILDNDKN